MRYVEGTDLARLLQDEGPRAERAFGSDPGPMDGAEVDEPGAGHGPAPPSEPTAEIRTFLIADVRGTEEFAREPEAMGGAAALGILNLSGG